MSRHSDHSRRVHSSPGESPDPRRREPGAAHAATTAARHERGRNTRRLRIIGGEWRGRRFRFPALDIRPTPDRVRETLFNWLQHRIAGARCLDLYAGSGALGLEALSRGAAEVIFVEQQRAAATALQQLLRDWGGSLATVACAQARHFLATAPAPEVRFDVVFVDPPYRSGELSVIMAALERGWLNPDSRVYVEHARSEPLGVLPAGWLELRAGNAGEVGYHLLAPRGEQTQ
jgi:16S rRNA (guanine966-N2)-methyltransferase